MAERTTSNPIAMLTQQQWRDSAALWVGVEYDRLSTAQKTELDRYIDETHEYLLQRFSHQPWGLRQFTGTVLSATGQIVLPADVRHLMNIREQGDGTTTSAVVGIPETIQGYYAATGSTVPTTNNDSPWTQQTAPRYYFVSMDDQNPPQQIWQRRPFPESDIPVDFLFRPYLGLLTTDLFAGLPADVVSAGRHHLRSLWAALQNDYEKSNNERQLREDHIAAIQMNDAPDAIEALISPQPPADFWQEMGDSL